MKKPGTLFYYIFIFVIAQIAWFSLLGIWIYWYVTNYLLLTEIGDIISPQVTSGSANIWALVNGLILLVLLSISMSLIFVYLNRQISLTRLYDTFIANVTHELKSPISSIQLYLETLRKREVPRDKQNEFINLMLKDIDRLGHLINSILYLSSMEQKRIAKKFTHDYHVYEADSVVRNVLNEVKEVFNLTDEMIKIEGRLSGQCVVDQYWLKIVFSNLVDNAIKYSRDQNIRIRIQLTSGPRYFSLDFIDQGIGIEPRNQKKIFNKFERIYNPESPNVKGTGLGLYWVKEITKYHGGKISVESSGINQGTTFKIALPVFEASRRRYINRLLRLSKNGQSEPEVHDD